MAAWDLADDGWRKLLQDRLLLLQVARNRTLNSPKTEQINALFYQAVGASDVSRAWYWPSMNAARAAEKLDDFVTLRGEVAHRGAAAAGVRKPQVIDYYGHVKKLVGRTALIRSSLFAVD